MNYETLEYSLDANLAIIRLSRETVMNALNTQMRAEITHAVKHAGQTARALVITGSGKAFCSGQDLGDGVHAGKADLERVLRDEYDPMLKAIHKCPIPTIAAVNGATAGAGVSLALAFDVVIASKSAFFTLAFSKIGLMPDAGATYKIPRLVGHAQAMGMSLFGDRISADAAAQSGLIYEAIDDELFEDHWKNRAQYLASGPTSAFKHIKTAMNSSFDNSFEQQLKLEAKLQNSCGKTRDFQEGVIAFLEKRPPNFEGR